jgi:hypothetical protein
MRELAAGRLQLHQPTAKNVGRVKVSLRGVRGAHLSVYVDHALCARVNPSVACNVQIQQAAHSLYIPCILGRTITEHHHSIQPRRQALHSATKPT